ncbi:MAG: type I-E CRISPR-associated endonuclease Cas1e [Thermoguttaceae bacterium]|nr:type I-E CRISPR-associated endonuclease Cas1e [Thermoguttaceae bacterium]MDW8079852.1 type I-E CRISPR-associated endonuclease Cas1e [Thermoguttaceae bacterium]
MPIFEKPDLESLPPVRQRWVPLYLEHGRLEVDDSSVKWIGADYTVLRIPVAAVSTLLLGPGTTITHAAVKACAEANTAICWIGVDGFHFYATGVVTTHDNANARLQAMAFASKTKRAEVARRMFARRFPGVDVSKKSLDDLRGMEGQRVRNLYAELGARYAVAWKGRRYDPNNWDLADDINKAISAANAALYALCTSVICSLGFLPALGFIHSDHPLAFVFDIADLYKHETSFLAAFQTLGANPRADEKDVLTVLNSLIQQKRILQRIPDDIKELLA